MKVINDDDDDDDDDGRQKIDDDDDDDKILNQFFVFSFWKFSGLGSVSGIGEITSGTDFFVKMN